MAVTITKKDKSTTAGTKQKATKPEVAKEGVVLLDGVPIDNDTDLELELVKPSANLSVEYADGSVKNLDFAVKGAAAYIGPTVNVGISLSFTKNTGNYENVKAQVSIHVPCTHDEIEDTYEFVKSWAEEKINEIHEEEDND